MWIIRYHNTNFPQSPVSLWQQVKFFFQEVQWLYRSHICLWLKRSQSAFLSTVWGNGYDQEVQEEIFGPVTDASKNVLNVYYISVLYDLYWV